MPLDPPFALGPLVDAAVAGIAERLGLAAVQQLMRLSRLERAWGGETGFQIPGFALPPRMVPLEKTENVGFQVRFLRQCLLDEQSPSLGRRPQKPNIRGLFVPYLLTVRDPRTARRLSLRPILSKADDSAILVRFL